MDQKKYKYPDQKRVSLRMPIKLYNALKREAQQRKEKTSTYIRKLLSSTKKPILATSQKDKIIQSNAKLDSKLDKLRDYPWREAENINQLAKQANKGELLDQITLNDALKKAKDEASKVLYALNKLKR